MQATIKSGDAEFDVQVDNVSDSEAITIWQDEAFAVNQNMVMLVSEGVARLVIMAIRNAAEELGWNVG